MPVPRLADHLDTADGPSDEEGEKDAKRQNLSRPHLSLLLADPHMSTMRLWESLKFHGGFGNATLQECLDRINQSRTDAPATCPLWD